MSWLYLAEKRALKFDPTKVIFWIMRDEIFKIGFKWVA